MESAAVQMARLQEQMKTVIDNLDHASKSRERMSVKLEKVADQMDLFDRRMEKVEHQLATTAPTIEEFIMIKHQVKGAGIFGKWLWAAGGLLIGVVFTMREQIRAWFL